MMSDIIKKPVMKDWQLFFKIEHGEENRMAVMKSFVDFYFGNAEELVLPGICELGGEIYDSPNHHDSVFYYTSMVKAIRRVGKEKGFLDVEHDVYCADTASGQKYYFRHDLRSKNMYKLIGDIYYLERFSHQATRYLLPYQRARGLL